MFFKDLEVFVSPRRGLGHPAAINEVCGEMQGELKGKNGRLVPRNPLPS